MPKSPELPETKVNQTFRTSLVRAAIGAIALGLTLVIGIGHAAYRDEQAGQQASAVAVTAPGPATGPGAQDGGNTSAPERVIVETAYTPPSVAGGGSLSNAPTYTGGNSNPNR
jgi:hypothetical protein